MTDRYRVISLLINTQPLKGLGFYIISSSENHVRTQGKGCLCVWGGGDWGLVWFFVLCNLSLRCRKRSLDLLVVQVEIAEGNGLSKRRQVKLCFFVSLIRGQLIPLHGFLVTLLYAFTIFVGESQAKLCICMSLVRGPSVPSYGLRINGVACFLVGI